MSGLFEHIAAADDSAIIAQRKASAVANKRVKDQFGAFIANARTAAEAKARIALVQDDITAVVNAVVAEYGGNAERLTASIIHSMGPAPMMQPGAMGAGTAPGGMGAGMGAPGMEQGATCPQCGAQTVNGQCPTCQGGAYGGAAGAQGGAYGLTHSIPQTPSTGPVQASHEAKGGFCDNCRAWKSGPKAGCTCDGDSAGGEAAEDDDTKESSVRESRRPKLCPYHSEVVDISLGSGDPQAGFNAMSSHAWGDKHCKGAFDGSCNFRPAMVTQKYWDDKRTEYDERREQRELDRQMQPAEFTEPELSIDTEPITHAEPLPDEPGKEGVSDIDGELANAPSAVGAGEMAAVASTKEAEALKTVDLPTGDDSALGGPSPKIDKGNSGDQGGWSLDPIDTQMDGSPHPTVEQDPTAKADYNKADFLDQTKAVTKSETLPTSTNFDDAGFNTDKNITVPDKAQWTGTGDQAKPVTRESISAVDPDKNPIRELMEEYSGFLMPNQVEAAVQDWDVG